MGKNTGDILNEILQKENERYKLDKIGFIQNVNTEIEYIIQHFNADEYTPGSIDSYREWRSQLLISYYHKRDLASFIQSHVHQKAFTHMVEDLFAAILERRFQTEARTEVDCQLAPTEKTLSYLLCPEDFIVLYNKYFDDTIHIQSTAELNQYCFGITKQIFPQDVHTLIGHLEQNHRLFWENLCLRLKTLVNTVTKTSIKPYNNEIVHDIWADTCLDLQTGIRNRKLEKEAGCEDILCYTVGIIRNNIREFFRKQKKSPYLFIENWEKDLSFMDNELFCNEPKDAIMTEDFLDLRNIDLEDEYEYRIALSCVLCDEDHPQHQQLIEGLEDKVEILLAHYVKNSSYEEIATEKYGSMSDAELKKKADKLRQDVTRVKSKIKERFKTIIDSKNK